MMTVSDFLMLLVEHDADQVRSIQNTFAIANLVNPLHVADGPEQAIRALSGEGGGRPAPSLVLIDVDLPDRGALALLEWLQRSAPARKVPVGLLVGPDSDPAAVAEWFWPSGYAPRVDLDARVGGAFRIEATARPDGGSAGDLAVGGEFTIVDAPSRLAFSWRWDDESGQEADGAMATTKVSIELLAGNGETTLVLAHDGFADRTDRDNHYLGWSECLDRLPPWLATH